MLTLFACEKVDINPTLPAGNIAPQVYRSPKGNIANPARDLYRKRCPEGHLFILYLHSKRNSRFFLVNGKHLYLYVITYRQYLTGMLDELV